MLKRFLQILLYAVDLIILLVSVISMIRDPGFGQLLVILPALAALVALIRTDWSDREKSGSGYDDGERKPATRVEILPRPPACFVNRLEELRKLKSLLVTDHQSVQIRGLGGLGKTQLAIRASHDFKNSFQAGVLWLSMIEHQSLDDLLNSIATAFHIETGSMPLNQKKILLNNKLSGKHFLLTLDNVTQHVNVPELMDVFTSATLLCTSRPPLVIDSLALFELGVLSTDSSMELFEKIIEKDLSAEDRSIVRNICNEELEGYPLAIALAARQANVQRLDMDFLERQIQEKRLNNPDMGNVRAPLLAAFEQLTPDEKQLFTSLSVFGGHTVSLEAIQSVSLQPDTEALIHRLIAYSLVEKDDHGRFGMHPLVKQFASENLDSGEPFLRMVDFYVMLLRDNQGSLDLVDQERANISSALNWCKANGESGRQLRLTDGLLGVDPYYSYWATRGYWQEGVQRLSDAIEASEANQDKESVGKYSLSLGLFLYWLGDHDRARQVYAKAEQVFQSVSNIRSLIQVCWHLGYIEDDEDNYERADELYRRSLSLAQDLRSLELINTSEELVAVVAYHRGDYQQADTLLRGVLARCSDENDAACVTRTQRRLGAVLRMQAYWSSGDTRQGYVEEARLLFRQCLEREKGERSRARALRQLGVLELAENDIEKADRYLRESLTLFTQLGNTKGIAATKYNLGLLKERQGSYREAEQLFSESLDLGRQIRVRMGVALNLRQLGLLAYRQGETGRGEQLLAESVSLLREIQSPYLGETEELIRHVRSLPGLTGKHRFVRLVSSLTRILAEFRHKSDQAGD